MWKSLKQSNKTSTTENTSDRINEICIVSSCKTRVFLFLYTTDMQFHCLFEKLRCSLLICFRMVSFFGLLFDYKDNEFHRVFLFPTKKVPVGIESRVAWCAGKFDIKWATHRSREKCLYIWNIVMVLIETQNNCLGEKKDCMTIVFIFFFFLLLFFLSATIF